MLQGEIDNNFSYHKPTSDDIEQFQYVRNIAKDVAFILDAMLCDCREKSLAMTKLEEMVFWVNAGIARGKGCV